MSLRTRQLFLSDYELPSPEEGLDVARQFLNSTDRADEAFFDGDAPLEQLHRYGQWLWKEHGIRQILLLGRREELMEIQSLQK